jgi:hypothetical protein
MLCMPMDNAVFPVVKAQRFRFHHSLYLDDAIASSIWIARQEPWQGSLGKGDVVVAQVVVKRCSGRLDEGRTSEFAIVIARKTQ